MNLVVHKPDSLMLHILVFKYIANLLQKLVCYVKPKKRLRPSHLQCLYMGQ